MSEEGYSSVQAGAVEKAKEPNQHSAREAARVLSESLQWGFFERQFCNYLKAAVMGVAVSKLPTLSQMTLLSYHRGTLIRRWPGFVLTCWNLTP